MKKYGDEKMYLETIEELRQFHAFEWEMYLSFEKYMDTVFMAEALKESTEFLKEASMP